MPEAPLLQLTRPSRIINLAGWDIADSFAALTDELTAIRAGCGVINRSERGWLHLAGEAVAPWLNQIVSYDVERLPPGESARALYLTVKGRIACDLRVFRLEDDLFIDTAFDTAEGFAQVLRQYILFGDQVAVTERRDETAHLAVVGPGAAELVRQVTGIAVGELGPGGARQVDHLLLARTDDLGLPGYDLWAPLARGGEFWAALCEGAQPFGWRTAEALRLFAGLPRWGAELTTDHLPLEAELDGALSPEKGCYPGQEIVARMRDRGHANRLLRKLEIDGEVVPRRQATLMAPGNPKPVGAITSAAVVPPDGIHALGYVRREQAELGTTLEVILPGGTAQATVAANGLGLLQP